MNRLQEIRHEVLLQLYGSKELPISATYIRKRARREGSDYSEIEIREALFFLTGQGFAERLQDQAIGQVLHRITSKGMLEWETNHA